MPNYKDPACDVVCAPGILALRAARQFSKRCTTTKKVGTNSTARQVEAIIPENTVMPIDLRALAPAPLATTSGATPRMKAKDCLLYTSDAADDLLCVDLGGR